MKNLKLVTPLTTYTIQEAFIAFDEVQRSLILLRDYGELVTLCKVKGWKIHIPLRAQKWSPCLIFTGACHSIVN